MISNAGPKHRHRAGVAYTQIYPKNPAFCTVFLILYND